ncbi:MAG: MgtC/SapB family protein [Candidatus Omnitrophica bacterium]|nr:MgtC/SapB family protein [Candidatus Omnitrophota bacterium]MCA9430689.1 MgtC/SapB family protein [Candidatus Omnitrophota bacterium]MCB9769144.1 MgtC/SapB family protein [Candidatus Omnitrophota bacterium]
MDPLNFNLGDAIQIFGRMGLAYLLAVPIGWNREASSRSAGLRTFPLVAAGACGFMLIGVKTLEGDDPIARVLYGIITGIGFIGGGAILKGDGTVSGTATAASIWNTGAIGIAVARGEMEIAAVLSGLNFLTLILFKPLKARIHHEDIQKHKGKSA